MASKFPKTLILIGCLFLWGGSSLSLCAQDREKDLARAKQLLEDCNGLIAQGKIPDVLPLVAESKSLAKRHEARERYMIASNNQLKIMLYLGQIVRAKEIFSEDRAFLFPELDSTYKHVDMHLELGFSLANEFEDIEEGRKLARIMYRRAEEADPFDSLALAIALDKMSRVAKMQGNNSKSLDYDLQAFRIRKANPKTSEVSLAISNFNLGQSYRELGDIGQAIYYFQEGYEISLKDKEPIRGKGNASEFCNAIGLLYNESNSLDKAELWLKRGLEIRQEVYGPEHPEAAKSMHNLAILYADREEPDKSLMLERQALAIKLKNFGTSHPLTLSSLSALATFERKAKNFRTADSLHSLTVELMDTLLDTADPTRSLYLTAWGESLSVEGKFDASLEKYQAALGIDIANFSPKDVYELPKQVELEEAIRLIVLMDRKARVLFRRYQSGTERNPRDLSASWEHISRSIDYLDTLHRSFQDDASRQSLAARRHAIYRIALLIAWELDQQNPESGYALEAFRLSEKFKSGLAYARNQEQQARSLGGVPAEIPALERKLSLEMARLRQDYKAEAEGGKQTELKNQLFQLKLRQDSLIALMEDKYPKYYHLKYDVSVPSLEEIQSHISSTEAMLSYVWDDTVAWVWVIKENDWEWRRLALKGDFAQQLADFETELQLDGMRPKATPGAFHQQAYELYAALLAPLADLISGSETLVISGGTGLSSWPFGLLATEPPGSEAARDFATLPYVLKRHLVRQIYQASQILPTGRSGRSELAFLGFAPEYPGTDTSLIASAGLALRGSGDQFFGPLRYNQVEVEKIAESWKGAVFTGEAATKDQFIQQSRKASLIHLAMHGYALPERPLYAGLVFTPSFGTPDAATEAWQDATLFGYEIFEEDLTAQLIVLSACQAGAGKWNAGEGVMSLARAFQFAGCPSVLSSLWQVDDAATAQLMVDFYEALGQGSRKSEALRTAQQAYLDRFPQAHPALWGGFVLIGSDSPLQQNFSWGMKATLLGLGLLLFVLLWYVRQKSAS